MKDKKKDNVVGIVTTEKATDAEGLVLALTDKGYLFFSAAWCNNTDNVYNAYLVAKDASKWESFKPSSFPDAFVVGYAFAGDLSELDDGEEKMVDEDVSSQFLGEPSLVPIEEFVDALRGAPDQPEITKRLQDIVDGRANFWCDLRLDR